MVASKWALEEATKMYGEPIPLKFVPPSQNSILDWVVNKVQDIQHCMAIDVRGYEE